MTIILKLARWPLRKVAALARTREVLFFCKHGSEPAPPAGVVELSRHDLEALRTDPARPWAVELGEPACFDDRGRLFAVEADGHHVSFGWAMQAQAFYVGELGGIVEIAEPALWIWACFTPPEHRGHGHYPALLRGIRGLMGHQQTVIYCLRENGASRRGIEKAGFEDAFSVVWHRLIVMPRRNVRGLFRSFRSVRPGLFPRAIASKRRFRLGPGDI
jgi:hypothetical protein